MALTPKQQRFVQEYLIDFNATQAAIRAGYTPTHADVTGPRLLGNVRVAVAVAEAREKQQERIELTQDEVINGLRREAARTGAGSQHPARVRAWELLGKHKAMFPDKIQVGGDPDGVPVEFIEIAASDARNDSDSTFGRNGHSPAH